MQTHKTCTKALATVISTPLVGSFASPHNTRAELPIIFSLNIRTAQTLPMCKLLGDMYAKYCHGTTFRREILNEPPSWESVWMFYDIIKENDMDVGVLSEWQIVWYSPTYAGWHGTAYIIVHKFHAWNITTSDSLTELLAIMLTNQWMRLLLLVSHPTSSMVNIY